MIKKFNKYNSINELKKIKENSLKFTISLLKFMTFISKMGDKMIFKKKEREIINIGYDHYMFKYRYTLKFYKFLNRHDIKKVLELCEKNFYEDNRESIKYIISEFKQISSLDFYQELNYVIQSIEEFSYLLSKKDLESLIYIKSILVYKKITEDDPYGEENWLE